MFQMAEAVVVGSAGGFYPGVQNSFAVTGAGQQPVGGEAQVIYR